MGFPKIRMRRLRTTATMRRLVRETAVSVDDLVYPLFVREGEGIREPIKSMDGCFHFGTGRVFFYSSNVLEKSALLYAKWL